MKSTHIFSLLCTLAYLSQVCRAPATSRCNIEVGGLIFSSHTCKGETQSHSIRVFSLTRGLRTVSGSEIPKSPLTVQIQTWEDMRSQQQMFLGFIHKQEPGLYCVSLIPHLSYTVCPRQIFVSWECEHCSDHGNSLHCPQAKKKDHKKRCRRKTGMRGDNRGLGQEKGGLWLACAFFFNSFFSPVSVEQTSSVKESPACLYSTEN